MREAFHVPCTPNVSPGPPWRTYVHQPDLKQTARRGESGAMQSAGGPRSPQRLQVGRSPRLWGRMVSSKKVELGLNQGAVFLPQFLIQIN
jgi:hypothetical protein